MSSETHWERVYTTKDPSAVSWFQTSSTGEIIGDSIDESSMSSDERLFIKATQQPGFSNLCLSSMNNNDDNRQAMDNAENDASSFNGHVMTEVGSGASTRFIAFFLRYMNNVYYNQNNNGDNTIENGENGDIVDKKSKAARAVAIDISPSALSTLEARLSNECADIIGSVSYISADISQPFESSLFSKESPVRHTRAKIALWHDRAVLHFLTDPSDISRYVANISESIAPNGFAIIGAFDIDGGPLKCSGLEVRRYSREIAEETFGENFDLIEESKEVHVTPGGPEQKFVFFLLRRK